MVDVLINNRVAYKEGAHFSVVRHKASIARRTQPMSGPIAVMLLWGPFIPFIAGMLLSSQN